MGDSDGIRLNLAFEICNVTSKDICTLDGKGGRDLLQVDSLPIDRNS